MILCGCTTEVDRRVVRGGYGHPPRRKSGGGQRRAEKGGEGRRRVDRVKKSGVSYVTINDGS